MASIRARHGKWQARIYRKGYPKVEKTFGSRSEAQKWANRLESEMESGCYIDRTEAERTLFADILARYCLEISPSKRGRQAESIRLRKLIASPIAKYGMTTLTSKVLAGWRDKRLQEVSGQTVNRELNIISAVINVAIREWGILLPVNPVSLIKRPEAPPGRDRRLDPAEETLLLTELTVKQRAANGTFTGMQNPWLKPLVQFALETAMRRGELLSLQWTDIDLSRRIAHLRQTKNGTSRTVPLSSQAIAVLENLPRSLDGRVFPLTAAAVKKGFTRACIRAGIVGVVFHTLRHEATSRLAERLPNVIELSFVTGHKDLRMLQRYYHPRAEVLAKKLG